MLSTVKGSQFFSENRKKSLYSDFRRLKITNTDGYDANVTAWKSVFLSYCREHHHLTFVTGPKLLNDLILAPYGKPQALDCVLDELQQADFIVGLDSYLGRFYMDVCGVRQPALRSLVSWSVASLVRASGLVRDDSENAAAGPGTLKERTFVVSDLVSEAAQRDVDYQGYVGSLFTFSGFVAHLKQTQPHYTALAAKCMLVWLYRAQKCAISPGSDMVDVANCPTEYESTVIKFGSNESVTEQDRSIANLKATVAEIEAKIRLIEARIGECTLSAKKYISQGAKSKSTALSYLRMRKMNESALAQTSASLVKLEEVMLAIDSAQTSQQVFSQIESSVGIIKRINSEIGGADRVNQVMDEFDEQKITSEEISRALEQDANGAEMDEEIDDELILMEAQERAKRGESDDVVDRLSDQFGGLNIPKSVPGEDVKENVEESVGEHVAKQTESLLQS